MIIFYTVLKEILKELKDYGYSNIIWSFLLSLFFILIARKIELQINIFGVIYIYVSCLCIGHYLVYNVKPGFEFKSAKGASDTFIVIPIVGAVTLATWGLIIWVLDIFFGIFAYFNHWLFYF